MIAVAQFIGLPLLFFSSTPDRAHADPGLDAERLAPEPGRVGGAGGARRGASRDRLGHDGSVPAPPRRVRRADDGVCDGELPRLPTDALMILALGDRDPAYLTHREVDAALAFFPAGTDWVGTSSPAARDLGWVRRGSGSCLARRTEMQMLRLPRSGIASSQAYRSSERAAGFSTHSWSSPAAERGSRMPSTRRASPKPPLWSSRGSPAACTARSEPSPRCPAPASPRSAVSSRSRGITTAATVSTLQYVDPLLRAGVVVGSDGPGRGCRGDRGPRASVLPCDRVPAAGRDQRNRPTLSVARGIRRGGGPRRRVTARRPP